MFVTGVRTAAAMRIAVYQDQAVQAVDRSAARIATGRRFLSFADDSVAATREISLRAQQGAVGIYLRATQDAGTAADTASAGLQSASDLLIQLRNAVLALDPSDSAATTATQKTVTQLTTELTRIGKTTTAAGGKNLLDGSITATPLSFTVAAGGSAADEIQLTAINLDAAQLGSASLTLDAIDFTTGAPTTQNDALAAIDAAQATVAESLASTAAVASAAEYHTRVVGAQVAALDTTLDNLVGVDVAEESLTLTTNRLRAEYATAMLAQVNALHASMVRQLLMSR
jgi:flagellin